MCVCIYLSSKKEIEYADFTNLKDKIDKLSAIKIKFNFLFSKFMKIFLPDMTRVWFAHSSEITCFSRPHFPARGTRRVE